MKERNGEERRGKKGGGRNEGRKEGRKKDGRKEGRERYWGTKGVQSVIHVCPLQGNYHLVQRSTGKTTFVDGHVH